MYKKRRFAKSDFTSIIEKYKQNEDFANPKIMSFTYWAWANQHPSKKDRLKAIAYLEKAIQLDQRYVGGRKRSEELKFRLEGHY